MGRRVVGDKFETLVHPSTTALVGVMFATLCWTVLSQDDETKPDGR